ncbi:MAG: 16S rRNA (cytosine(1402)-N(4))-methyltransferase RsmH [Gammaproteobacteria bacterium]
MTETAGHETVLKESAVAALNIRTQGAYVDATFGRGGHSKAILDQLGDQGSLLVLDRDPDAITVANLMAEGDSRMTVSHCDFSQLGKATREWNNEGVVDGILFDLGVSSPQLDNAERGFSFMRSGPLDMRMNPMQGISAAEWLNTAPENEIAEILFRLGEEKHARRMARAIVAQRALAEISSTGQLAEIVKQANPAWERDKHPATRAFQAIRIHINDEIAQLESALEQALQLLKPGGRLVVISFHSLEDRIVKKFMAKQTKGDSFPRHLPVTADLLKPRLKTIGKKIRADAVEVSLNPRARSAVMRVAEKLQ